jgi:hypothetical protein
VFNGFQGICQARNGIINRKDYTERKEKTLFPPNFINITTLVAGN